MYNRCGESLKAEVVLKIDRESYADYYHVGGEKVEVISKEKKVIGTITHIGSDSISIKNGSEGIVIPIDSITHIDIYTYPCCGVNTECSSKTYDNVCLYEGSCVHKEE